MNHKIDLLLLLVSNSLFGQIDFDYILQKGEKLIDIRNGNVINDDFLAFSMKRFESDYLKVISNVGSRYLIEKFDLNLNKIWTINNFNGVVGPNWDYVFIVENGDIYKSKIDWHQVI